MAPQVLLPLLAKANNASALNCMEASHGRFYDMDEAQKDTVREDLDRVTLQWRHCPFGLHALAGAARVPVYITMLRDPYRRLKVCRSDTFDSPHGDHHVA
jgi:hypothetical protein